MVRAIIFDFNGVIADDDPIHMRALRQVAREEGMTITDEEYLDTYLPFNDRDCFTTLYSRHARPLHAGELDELIRRKGAYYWAAIEQKSVLFMGAAEAVKAAAARGPAAIASGARSEEIRYILRQADLESCFAAIVAAEDVEHGKPHPEPFLKAWQLLNETHGPLAQSDCVAVEDSIGGIDSAHSAGMRCVAIAHSYGAERLQAAKPEWIIDSISDFAAWIQNIPEAGSS